MRQGFLFIELAAAPGWIEVLRVGEFVDQNGRRVVVREEDLDAYVRAFEENAAGQEIPVDVDHERAAAAGWIRGLRRAGNVLEALPEWNELGRGLVGDRVYRYVSATIDLAGKVIRSISLVNFPAVKGLRPVELAEGGWTMAAETGLLERIVEAIRGVFGGAELMIKTEDGEVVLYSRDGKKVLGRFPFGPGQEYEDEEAARAAAHRREGQIERFSREGGDAEGKDVTERVESAGELSGGNETQTGGVRMAEEEQAELRERIREEERQKLEAREAELAEMRATMRAELEAELREQFARRQELATFAAEITSGEQGLSAKPEEVVAALEGLEPERQELVKGLLRAKVVEFGEAGSGREGTAGKVELPAEYAGRLDSGELSLADLSNPILGLGELGQYDLAKWQK